MSSYELKVLIDDNDVERLNSIQRKIVIIKTVNENMSSTTDVEAEQITGVSWVTFAPWPKSIVTWQSDFAVYASDIQLQSGAKIETESIKNAKSGIKLYEFNNNNLFKELNHTAPDSNTYCLRNVNQSNRTYTFGLAQSVKVGNLDFELKPINATQLMVNENVSFKPIEKLKVFLQTNAEDSKVISVIQSNVLDVDLTVNSAACIKYNPTLNKFEQVVS